MIKHLVMEWGKYFCFVLYSTTKLRYFVKRKGIIIEKSYKKYEKSKNDIKTHQNERGREQKVSLFILFPRDMILCYFVSFHCIVIDICETCTCIFVLGKENWIANNLQIFITYFSQLIHDSISHLIGQLQRIIDFEVANSAVIRSEHHAVKCCDAISVWLRAMLFCVFPRFTHKTVLPFLLTRGKEEKYKGECE